MSEQRRISAKPQHFASSGGYHLLRRQNAGGSEWALAIWHRHYSPFDTEDAFFGSWHFPLTGATHSTDACEMAGWEYYKAFIPPVDAP